MVIFFSTSLYAQQADVKKFYVGAGGSYDNKVNVIIPLAVKVSLWENLNKVLSGAFFWLNGDKYEVVIYDWWTRCRKRKELSGSGSCLLSRGSSLCCAIEFRWISKHLLKNGIIFHIGFCFSTYSFTSLLIIFNNRLILFRNFFGLLNWYSFCSDSWFQEELI